MKVLALTSIRSDYDLMSPLYELLHVDQSIDFRLLVAGAHLSHSFGYTIKHIKDDGYPILLEVETLIDSDSTRSRLKTASMLLQNSIDAIYQFSPDLILYPGDREDVIVGALIGSYLNIPTIHFYGGDHEKDGHQDTYIRHATSKLSSVHFVSANEHAERLIRMGEKKSRIFNIGSISLDKFKNVENNIDLSSYFNTPVPSDFAVLIFHPLMGENSSRILENILQALAEEKIFTFISYPNTDPGHSELIKIIESHSGEDTFLSYKNLNREVFIALLNQCKFLIGNSSAGIYELASLKKPAINVGMRQRSRMCSENVVFSGASLAEIKKSLKLIASPEFSKKLLDVTNPYGDGKSAERAYQLIKDVDFRRFMPKIEDPLEFDNE